MTEVTDWLLDSDPSIRWQTMRDLLDRPEDEWRPVRAQVETTGWGAALLGCADPDGQWAGGVFVPAGFTRELWDAEGQPWTASSHVVTLLRELGLPPASAAARRMVEQLCQAEWWEGQPFWSGETEECINGRLVADGAYFGVDMTPLVDRLLSEQQPDGGWNCERPNGSTRSSYHSTINVLEGLLAHERATGATDPVRQARARGEEFLLERHLFRRLSTGGPADDDFLLLKHPHRWHYDILRGLDHLRAAGELDGTPPDPRAEEAVALVAAKRQEDGRWLLDAVVPGRTWLDLDDGPGDPSRWVTLEALRVLRWWRSGRDECRPDV